MQGRILDRAALQILAALAEGPGLQKAGLPAVGQMPQWQDSQTMRNLPEKSRRFFDLAREVPEIHIGDPGNPRESKAL